MLEFKKEGFAICHIVGKIPMSACIRVQDSKLGIYPTLSLWDSQFFYNLRLLFMG